MNLEKNPLIEPYDYWRGYQESINKLKNDPKSIEFDKICYEIFECTDAGRKLMEIIIDRYLMPSLVHGDNKNYANACIWSEGFKAAFRILLASKNSHHQRVKAETNQ